MEDAAFKELVTERCVIRRLLASDVEGFVAYRNDPEVARYQGWELPYTLEAGNKLAAELAQRGPGRAGEWFQFAVLCDGEHIGDCALRCDDDPRTAELGFTVAKKHQNQGFGKEMASAVLVYAFETLKIRRVAAIIDDRNVPAKKLLEALDFQLEGHLRENVYSRGEWTSELIFAKLRHDR